MLNYSGASVRFFLYFQLTGLSGIVAPVLHILASVSPSPFSEKARLVLTFLSGFSFMLMSYGLFHLVRAYRETVILQIGILFNISATAFVTTLLVIHQILVAFNVQHISGGHESVASEYLEWIFNEINSMRAGIDLTWDLFISTGTFLLCISLWGHPCSSRFLCILGMMTSGLSLTFNLLYFPASPREACGVDFGKLVVLWYILLMSNIWIRKEKMSSSFQASGELT